MSPGVGGVLFHVTAVEACAKVGSVAPCSGCQQRVERHYGTGDYEWQWKSFVSPDSYGAKSKTT